MKTTIDNTGSAAGAGSSPSSCSETVRLELRFRVVEYHTVEREVEAAEWKAAQDRDVGEYLNNEFRDDGLADSDYETVDFEVDEWKIIPPNTPVTYPLPPDGAAENKPDVAAGGD